MEPVLQTYIVTVEIPVTDTLTFEFEVQASSLEQAESFTRAELPALLRDYAGDPGVAEGDYQYDDAEFSAALDSTEDDEL